MKKALRLLLYGLVFLLVFGSRLHSGSTHSPFPCPFGDRLGLQDIAVIDDANILELIEQTLPYIVEEISSERQDDGSDDGKVFNPGNGIQCSWPCPDTVLFHCANVSVPCRPLAGKTAPLYLLHRVFRI